MWYDQPPIEYAKGLRYNADRSDETADRCEKEGKPWSQSEVEHFRRAARRLRAMALLCDRSRATRAGDVNFLGMSSPAQTNEELDSILHQLERDHAFDLAK